jgi:hypothetical protein
LERWGVSHRVNNHGEEIMRYLLNAFSLNMVGNLPCNVKVEEVGVDQARMLAEGVTSGVGHADTAAVFSSILGISIPMNRATFTLSQGDSVLVGQYSGPRMPEGSTTLPEGATIKWLVVSVS